MIRKGAPALILAPMEGVTDAPMRAFLTELGGFTHCVSEFLRVSQVVPPAKVFRAHVPELSQGCRTPSGIPVQIQLLGGDPEKLAEAAALACELGSPGVDLNFGCPAPTVNRHDGGATLLKFPHRIRGIVEAVRAAVPRELPVSAKFRLGWDSHDPIHLNTDMAAQAGASWITIHGRTKVAGYTPPAYWEPIGEVSRRLAIPVVANGDIWSLEDFKRCRDQSFSEHFMLGRGALADPTLATRIAQELGMDSQSDARRSPSSYDGSTGWSGWVHRFVTLCQTHSDTGGEGYAVRRIKQWIRLAASRQELPWFDELKRMTELRAMLSLLPK